MQSRTKTPLCCNLKTLKVYYPWLWIFYFAEELLRQHWGELLSPALGPTSPFPTEVAGRWGCTEDPQAQGRSGLFLPHFEVLENSQELELTFVLNVMRRLFSFEFAATEKHPIWMVEADEETTQA